MRLNPTSVKANGGESCLQYLTVWTHTAKKESIAAGDAQAVGRF
jgi:hypothetical protein